MVRSTTIATLMSARRTSDTSKATISPPRLLPVLSRGGWCRTCQGCQDWGWCVPGCDGVMDLQDTNNATRSLHELPVDSFVYENCSFNVDPATEFCTGMREESR